MAELGVRQIVCVLFAAIAAFDVAATFKPGYIERTLDDEDICHPLGRTPLRPHELKSNLNGSVVVRHSHLYSTWQRDCKFVFRARKGGSLIAVIQNMYLRTNDSKCLDYIQFRRKDRLSLKLCGEIDRGRNVFRTILSDDLYMGQSEVSGEFDSEGQIETIIYRSPVALTANEKLDLTIVYTPYEDCRKIKSQREDYREIVVSESSSICMWKGYFCDGYQNCVSVLCQDEEGCPPRDVVSDGTGTKVTIGAVTTMLLCFIIFLMGLWICRRHKKLCWSSDCAGPNLHEGRSPRGDREVAEVASHPSVAVSPMLEVAVLPSVLDKDSPPSYESLFPEQANNPSTT